MLFNKMKNIFRFFFAMFLTFSLWLPSEIFTQEYSYGDYSECCDYQCSSSCMGFTTKDAIVIGIAATLGGVIGAVASNGKKGSRGGIGERGDRGDRGEPGTFTFTTGLDPIFFTFHSGPQTTATGIIKGSVTAPDQSSKDIQIPINAVDNTALITYNPPTLEGEYVISVHIHELTGILNTAPSVTVSADSQLSNYTANLPQAFGQQTNFSFVYTTFLVH